MGLRPPRRSEALSLPGPVWYNRAAVERIADGATRPQPKGATVPDSMHVHVSIRLTYGWNDEIAAEVKSAIADPAHLADEVDLAVKKAHNDIDRILNARRKLDEALEQGRGGAELTA